MKKRIRDASGLYGWAVIAIAVVFSTTRHLWFDNLKPEQKIEFWLNLGVAAGTIALAIVTVLSLRQTRQIIEVEDRRHRQRFAPLVKINYLSGNDPYYEFENSGLGPAVNLEISVSGTRKPSPGFASGDIKLDRTAAAVGAGSRHTISELQRVLGRPKLETRDDYDWLQRHFWERL